MDFFKKTKLAVNSLLISVSLKICIQVATSLQRVLKKPHQAVFKKNIFVLLLVLLIAQS